MRIKALRREKEILLLMESRQPLRFRILRDIPIVLRVLLRIAAVLGVFLFLAFMALVLRWRPR